MEATERTRLRRMRHNGSHRREDLDAVLAAGFLCHLGVVVDGAPMVVPTVYGVEGDTFYVHGSVASRSLVQAPDGVVCVTVTHVDGLVLARSVFEHGVNYRCAMIYGVPRVVTDPDEKLRGCAPSPSSRRRGSGSTPGSPAARSSPRPPSSRSTSPRPPSRSPTALRTTGTRPTPSWGCGRASCRSSPASARPSPIPYCPSGSSHPRTSPRGRGASWGRSGGGVVPSRPLSGSCPDRCQVLPGPRPGRTLRGAPKPWGEPRSPCPPSPRLTFIYFSSFAGRFPRYRFLNLVLTQYPVVPSSCNVTHPKGCPELLAGNDHSGAD